MFMSAHNDYYQAVLHITHTHTHTHTQIQKHSNVTNITEEHLDFQFRSSLINHKSTWKKEIFQFPDTDTHISRLKESPVMRSLSSSLNQCKGILRNQKRALKSSEQVRNAGAVGEWTISLTGPLCPATNHQKMKMVFRIHTKVACNTAILHLKHTTVLIECYHQQGHL